MVQVATLHLFGGGLALVEHDEDATCGSLGQSVPVQHCRVLGQVHVPPAMAHVSPLSVAQSAFVQQAALEMHDMLVMHCFSPEGHAHTPPGIEQTWPVMVHSPVLQHVPMGIQVPEAAQGTWPAGQEPAEHVPFMHVPVPQLLPHAPQLEGSLFRFAQ